MVQPTPDEPRYDQDAPGTRSTYHPQMDGFVPPLEATRLLKGATEQQLIAALELMYLVAKADGFVAADELRQFLAVAKAVDHSVDSRRLSALIGAWKAQGPVDVTERARALGAILATNELRRAAYDLASATVTADRSLSGSELETIVKMGDALGVT